MNSLQKITEDPAKCPGCGSNNVITDEAGETVCRNCGYVYPVTTVNRGPEWRAFNPKQRKERPRTGAPLNPTIHDQGLSTVISRSDVNYLPKEKRFQFYRLQKWNRRTKVSRSHQRNLAQALSYMILLSDELNLPRNVSETGANIYRQALKKGATRGRTINNMVVASLYAACRVCNVSRNLTEFANASNISKKIAARNYRYLHDLLDQEIPLISTGKIISNLVIQLKLSGRVEQVALEVLRVASDLKITSGKSPSGIAAAVTYIGCCIMGEKVTQSSIASRARVTGVTIRNRYKELVGLLDLETSL